MAFDHGVGAVAHHRQHAFIAQRLQRGFVRGRADQGFRVQFEVARVQHDAGRGADDQRLGFRYRMRHADELQAERLEGEAAARGDGVHRNLVEQPSFRQLAAQNGGSKRGGVNRALQLRP